MIGTGRQRVGRPPAQVVRLLADGDLRAGGRVGRELQVQVASRHAQRTRQRMDMHGNEFGVHPQAGDPGFLGGLAQRSGHEVVVFVFAVPAQLHPPAQPRVQSQQHPAAAVIEHQRRSGDVSGYALHGGRRPRGPDECQHRMP